MAARLKLIVAYDGAPFDGWQSQASGSAVQDHLERAFARITKQKLRVHGAGRTDAGVHALGQCAHVDLAARTLSPEQWPLALNTCLPATIQVLRCAYVGSQFHARFSARGKVYRYRVWNDRILPPLELGRAWHVPGRLDPAALESEARTFVGKHDFASFAANRGKSAKVTVRTIESLRVRRSGKVLRIEVSGDGFLYKMVRLMVGALVEHGRGRVPAGTIRERLAHPARSGGNPRVVAPAEGLFLVRVRY